MRTPARSLAASDLANGCQRPQGIVTVNGRRHLRPPCRKRLRGQPVTRLHAGQGQCAALVGRKAIIDAGRGAKTVTRCAFPGVADWTPNGNVTVFDTSGSFTGSRHRRARTPAATLDLYAPKPARSMPEKPASSSARAMPSSAANRIVNATDNLAIGGKWTVGAPPAPPDTGRHGRIWPRPANTALGTTSALHRPFLRSTRTRRRRSAASASAAICSWTSSASAASD